MIEHHTQDPEQEELRVSLAQDVGSTDLSSTAVGHKILDTGNRIKDYEKQLKNLGEIAADALERLRAKTELLDWIVNSRSWQVTAWMRRAKLAAQKARSRPRWSSRTGFYGELERPAAGDVVDRYLDISGWANSRGGAVARVEVYLDDIPLGTVPHGLERPDLVRYLSDIPIKCGFGGRLLVDESFAGRRKLLIRITDRRNNIKDLALELTIKPTPATKRAGVPGSGSRSPALADSASDVLMRDDLSTAKRLASAMGRIGLETCLASGSRITLPECERPEVTVILVLFNRAELTLQCIYSLLASRGVSFELVIVDNGSTDDTRELLPRVDGATIILNDTNLHFLRAVNQAARVARGENILLLNNDAQPEPYSIASALRTLNSSDDIGAVGGRIILQDGSLQEAGSIIWRDGSCLGYGRGEFPLSERFLFKRDVDYCSGAFLLTRSRLFLEDGGFDEDFAPAYYEETDYCVRLWKRGMRVVYDPDVTVIHYEFASSGKSQDAIDLQTRHRSVFVEKHREWLADQHAPSPENVRRASHRLKAGTKRILYVDDRVPHLDIGQGFPRSNNIVRSMVELGYFVTVFPMDQTDERVAGAYRDIPREVEIVGQHGRAYLQDFLLERMGEYDLIYVARPHNMANLKRLLETNPGLCGDAKIIYDAEAIFSLREIEEAALRGRKRSPRDRQKLIDEEIGLASNCFRVVSVSDREAREFTDRGIASVYTLGHTLETEPTPATFDSRKGLLFVGATNTPDSPNADSINWLKTGIMPRLKAIDATIALTIAGPIHEEVQEGLTDPAISVMGRVDDLTPLYNGARIFVAPTRFAAGIPHKVHEAAAHGLPCVVTGLLASQLGWQHQVDVLVANTEAEFAAACARLHEDKALWQRLRENALRRIQTECSPTLFRKSLEEILL